MCGHMTCDGTADPVSSRLQQIKLSHTEYISRFPPTSHHSLSVGPGSTSEVCWGPKPSPSLQLGYWSVFYCCDDSAVECLIIRHSSLAAQETHTLSAAVSSATVSGVSSTFQHEPHHTTHIGRVEDKVENLVLLNYQLDEAGAVGVVS